VPAIVDDLIPAVRLLRDTLARKAEEFRDVVKIGRTHLQDATPLTLGRDQRLGGAARSRPAPRGERASAHARAGARGHRGGDRVERASGVRRPGGSRDLEADRTPVHLRAEQFEALAAHDALVFAHGALKTLAVSLMKIANDVRWLASGPRSGLGEIKIPENEPGSSIMPGKVNPTQSEAMTMLCAR